MITSKEKILAAEMLKLAKEAFSNHGCNDVNSELWKDWTLEERQQFVKEYHKWNGDPEEYGPNYLDLGDSTIMGFLAAKLILTK